MFFLLNTFLSLSCVFSFGYAVNQYKVLKLFRLLKIFDLFVLYKVIHLQIIWDIWLCFFLGVCSHKSSEFSFVYFVFVLLRVFVCVCVLNYVCVCVIVCMCVCMWLSVCVCVCLIVCMFCGCLFKSVWMCNTQIGKKRKRLARDKNFLWWVWERERERERREREREREKKWERNNVWCVDF